MRRIQIIITIFFEFGTYLYKQNKYLQAIPLFEKAISLAKGEDETAQTLCNLGVLYSDSNRYGEAEKVYNKALEIFKKLAKQNPRVFEIQFCATLMNIGLFQADLLKKEPKQEYKTKGLSFAERAISILSKYPDVPQAQEYMKGAIKLKQELENPPVK